jgi:predicted dehydrogenase
VIGCGLVGSRRARVAAAHPRCRLEWLADAEPGRARGLAAELGTRAQERPLEALDQVDVVVVATPNGCAPALVEAALTAGRHVLMEKPMGRSLAEARRLLEAARASGRLLKIGFNHRYHPGLARARQLFVQGRLGPAVSLRARYGHGGRPGYEKEWRGDPELAGGGVLLDQGVHLADLCHWLLGLPRRAFALLQRAVWPLGPLEDSAFALLEYAGGQVASFHVAWTQWKNLFSLELFGRQGSVTVEGLGGSYGTERLALALRRPEGGPPDLVEEVFPGPDTSWQREWEDMVEALEGGNCWATAEEGLAAMRILDALYRSARSGQAEDV